MNFNLSSNPPSPLNKYVVCYIIFILSSSGNYVHKGSSPSALVNKYVVNTKRYLISRDTESIRKIKISLPDRSHIFPLKRIQYAFQWAAWNPWQQQQAQAPHEAAWNHVRRTGGSGEAPVTPTRATAGSVAATAVTPECFSCIGSSQ